MDIRPGQVIAKRYVIKELVGRGGMGRIYRVQDNVLDEEVALKTLLPQYVEDKLVLDRFLNEARIARQLSHPAIVRVHDIGNADGVVYISMEMLGGRSLREVLERQSTGKRLPVHAVLRMFDGLCAALDYAHKYTVHRDIKPENVMVQRDGSVKLMDFGISKLMSNPSMTSASMVMGTPHYMSPEQLKDSSKVDARADVYSLGVMLYEILTGQTPTGVPRPASETSRRVPPLLDPIIAKCVDPDPNKRFQSAGELREALRKIRVDIETRQGIKSKDPTWASTDPSKSSAASGAAKRKAMAVVLTVIILAVTGGGLNWAESLRQIKLDALHAKLPVSADPTSGEAIRAHWIGVALEAGETAADHALEEINGPDRVLAEEALELGKQWRIQAEGATGSQPKIDAGLNALSCFWALTEWPEDMLFIPPAGPPSDAGSVEASPGYFVDLAPVSNSDFRAFAASRSEWKQRYPRGDEPVVDVAAFDAVAYLVAQGQELPTLELWKRAMDSALGDERILIVRDGTELQEDPFVKSEEEDEEEDEVEVIPPAKTFYAWEHAGEWTRTIVEGGVPAEGPFAFGQMLFIAGEASVQRLAYEDSQRDVTFRGVMLMPQNIYHPVDYSW